MPGHWELRYSPTFPSWSTAVQATAFDALRATRLWIEEPPRFGRSEFRDAEDLAQWIDIQTARWGSEAAWQRDAERRERTRERDALRDMWLAEIIKPPSASSFSQYIQEFTPDMAGSLPPLASSAKEPDPLAQYMQREDLFNRSYIAIWGEKTVRYWRIRGHISGTTLARVLSRYYATEERVALLMKYNHVRDSYDGASFLSPEEVYSYDEGTTTHPTGAWYSGTHSITGWRMFMWKEGRWLRRVGTEDGWEIVDPHGSFEP